MASLKFTLVLSMVVLPGSARTSSSAGLQSSPDAVRVTGDICQDCTQIFELLKDLLSSSDLEKKMVHGVESLCNRLPAVTAALCKEEVEKMLPMAVSFITGFVNPKEVCKSIGLCGAGDQQEKMLGYFVEEALQAAVTTQNGHPASQCSICIFIFKTLEDLLPKERTEAVVVKLLEEICHIVPIYRHECEHIIDTYLKILLDAIMQYATPNAICSLIHLCKGQQEALADPCTWKTYRCRDVPTALRCGTLFYCQRFAWKPLDDELGRRVNM